MAPGNVAAVAVVGIGTRCSTDGQPLDTDDVDLAYFGLSYDEAARLDGAARLFLECAAAALEDAGHDPVRIPGRLGVFGLARQLPTLGHLGLAPEATVVTTEAVPAAVRALRAGECDIAVAGTATRHRAAVRVLRRLSDIGRDHHHEVVPAGSAPVGPAPAAAAVTAEAQVFPLSAATPPALTALVERLAAWLREHPDTDPADVAHTLRAGRRALPYRTAVLFRSPADLRAGSVAPVRGAPRAAFMFPGVGAQHRGMGALLYQRHEVYRREVDTCLAALDAQLAARVREVLVRPRPRTEATDPIARLRGGRRSPDLTATEVAQPALFVSEYALARQLMAWGVRPAAVIGHSLGEYVAACVAGMLPVRDAVRLVAARAQLIGTLPAGAMLAVPLPEDQLRQHVLPGVDVAAVNGKSACVLSGDAAEVAEIATQLGRIGVAVQRVDAQHAFHSRLLAPVADDLARLTAGIRFRPPSIPCVSTLSGTWFTEGEATDPRYWARHLCGTVRFHDGVGTLLADRNLVFLEAGHGTALSSFVRQHARMTRGRLGRIVPALPVGLRAGSEHELLLGALGELWQRGVPVGWETLSAGTGNARISLPGYPFDRVFCCHQPTYADQDREGAAG